MKFEIKQNGGLSISAEPTDKDFLEDLKSRNGGNDIVTLADILEHTGWSGNGQLMQVSPEDIGALTDAPILTDDRTIDDNGDVTVNGKVWWYPDYCVRYFLEDLLENGVTDFQAA